jgi:glyoxylase-like metal-dependent hydrolase (beta-lactamase superfamily II)
MKTLDFGGITVDRAVETEGPSFHPGFIFPDATPEAIDGEMSWLLPHFLDADSSRLLMSLHSYVIRTKHHTILVDTCIGNDKERPSTPPWHHRDTAWLDDLRAMGVAPESVDFVMCTHLHADHVGWNTRLENGRWVPTFSNARYLFHKDEYAHWESNEMPNVGSGTTEGSFEDSVLPVVAAGLADLVENNHAIDDSLFLEPSPGHTPGHTCLHLKRDSGQGLFTGDMLHHPIQCAYPEWNSRYCFDPARSRATRESYVERYADTDTQILAAHFPMPVAGRIVSNGPRCKFSV